MTSPHSPDKPLRVLMVEDMRDDALLLKLALSRGGYRVAHRQVANAGELEAALAEPWDMVLADFALPAFSGLEALKIVRARDADLPFILVSGAVGEDVAVAAMKAGAQDYVLKDNLRRLVPAVERELREADLRRDKREADLALLRARDRLQTLSQRMLERLEEERRHLARELHDGVGQSLTALRLHLQALAPTVSDAGTRQLQTVMTILADTLAQIRSLSLDLRPPELEDFGLAAALAWMVRRAPQQHPKVSFACDVPPPRFARQAEAALFRMAQEGLSNALRHSAAEHIVIHLSAPGDEILLEVHDDGCGFDLVASESSARQGESLGLLSLRERAALCGAAVDLQSGPGQGTKLRVTLKLPRGETEKT